MINRLRSVVQMLFYHPYTINCNIAYYMYVIPGKGHIGSGFPSAGAVQRNTRNVSYVTYMDLHIVFLPFFFF